MSATPKGYWIGHVVVTNPERYPDYMKAAQPAYEKYGARFVVRGGASEQAESHVMDGTKGARHVVIEFESYAAAQACYQSPEYQAAAKIRRQHSTGDIVIVEGTAP